MGVDGGVGQLVGPAETEMQVPHHLVGGVVVGTRIQPGFGLRCGDLAVAVGAPAGPDASAVPLVVADDGFLTRPLHGHRPVDAPFGQPAGSQRQDDLHRRVLAPAECAADGRVAHPDALLGQVERVGDLLAVLVHPLAGDLDIDDALGVHP